MEQSSRDREGRRVREAQDAGRHQVQEMRILGLWRSHRQRPRLHLPPPATPPRGLGRIQGVARGALPRRRIYRVPRQAADAGELHDALQLAR